MIELLFLTLNYSEPTWLIFYGIPSPTLFWPFQGNKSPAIPYFGVFNEINS